MSLKYEPASEPLAGIKMERLCELALNVKPDWESGTIDCAVRESSLLSR